MARGRLRDRFVFRRLAADARKVELGKNNDMELKAKLFGVMGREPGAIHAASPGALSRIRADLAGAPGRLAAQGGEDRRRGGGGLPRVDQVMAVLRRKRARRAKNSASWPGRPKAESRPSTSFLLIC